MRILLLTDSRECGGVERHLLGVAKELHRRGHRLQLAGTGDPRLAPFEREIRPFIDAAPRAVAFDSPRELSRAGRLALRLSAATDLLLVSAHSTLSCYYPLWLAERLGCPTLLVQQLIDPKARLDGVTRARRSSQLRSCRALVAVSRAVRETLHSSFELGDRDPVVIPNGADTQRFAFAPSRDPEAPLLCLARLSPQKGLDHLLRALAALARTRPGLRLEIAGDGEERERLQALARELEVGERVRFLGAVNDVPGFLGRGRILVLPSLDEGLPLALAEGMASGLVPVATAVGGTPELLDEGRIGYLVPPADETALARALDAALSLPIRDSEALGKRAREQVIAAYDAEAGARAIADIAEQSVRRCASTDTAGT